MKNYLDKSFFLSKFAILRKKLTRSQTESKFSVEKMNQVQEYTSDFKVAEEPSSLSYL